jgi:prepilin-type processing-associated H-X9-DG protein
MKVHTKRSNKKCGADAPVENRRTERAFSLLELMVVLGVITVMALLLPTAMARPRTNNQACQCLNNQKNLISAWQMYAEDNNGKVVTNFVSSTSSTNSLPYPGMTNLGLDWSTNSNNTNVMFLVDDKYSKLAKYLNRSVSVYQCPLDTYLSPAQKAAGWSRRVRSVSISLGIGEGNAETAPWQSTAFYRNIRKSSDFLYPGPSEAFVFLEEHPDSILDPAFFAPTRSQWIDLPATHHYGAAPFSFADGHVEMHKWIGSLAVPAVQKVAYISTPQAPPGYDEDLHWVSYRTPRVSTNSY